MYFAYQAAKRAGDAKDAALQASADAKRTMILSQIQDDLNSIVLSLNLLEESLLRTDWSSCVRLSREVYLKASRASEKPKDLLTNEEQSVLEKVITTSEKMVATFREAFEADKLASKATIETSITALTGDCVKLIEVVKGKAHVE